MASEERRAAELVAEVNKWAVALHRSLAELPEAERLTYLRTEGLASVPADIRDAVTSCVLTSLNLAENRRAVIDRRWLASVVVLQVTIPLVVLFGWGERPAVFAFGLASLGGVVFLSFSRDALTAPQVQVIRTITALAAGAVGALIPGFLDISSKVELLTIRSGGGIAAFVLVYLRSPAK